MTINEAIAYINNFSWSTSRLGLERTRELLERLGNPQERLRFIHVAGTNGKGSTCAMLERILRSAGYITGFYPSPYIEDFRERIQVCGEYISEDALCSITERVSAEADAMADHPSQFELITAVGMLYFEQMHCDIVVLEVGMGGSLDSTNVIPAPLAAVITNIGLDHTEYLGDTVEKIAAVKAGIIKPGTHAVCYRQQPSVEKVIADICREKGVMLSVAGKCTETGHDFDGQEFIYKDKQYKLSLLGRHQLANAAVVLETIDVLRSEGCEISDEAVRDGLAAVKWPARFEVLGRSPLFVLDGGHNPQCAEALADCIREYAADPDKGEKVCFLIGMLADKDYETTLKIIRPFGAYYVCITPGSPRALPAEKLAEDIIKISGKCADQPTVVCEHDISRAIRTAENSGLPVIAFGSLYSAGDIRRTYREMHCGTAHLR